MYAPGEVLGDNLRARPVRPGGVGVAVDNDNNALMLAVKPLPLRGQTPVAGEAQSSIHIVRGKVDATGQVSWGPSQILGSSTLPTHEVHIHERAAYTRVAMSPANGHAAVAWASSDVCSATAYDKAPNRCYYLYLSQYDPATSTWSAPQVVTDLPLKADIRAAYLTDPVQLRVDNAGNVAIMHTYWMQRRGTPPLIDPTVAHTAVSWRLASAPVWRRHIFAEHSRETFNVRASFDLDNNGNMVWAGTVPRDSKHSQVVVARGTLSAGFGVAQRIDTAGPSASALLGRVRVHRGLAAVDWAQSVSDGPVYRFDRHLAVSPAAGQPWQASQVRQQIHGKTDSDIRSSFHRDALYLLGITNAGEVLAYDFIRYALEPSQTCGVYVRAPDGAINRKDLPQPLCSATRLSSLDRRTINRRGDVLYLREDGLWRHYTAATHSLVSSGDRALTGSRNLLGPTLVYDVQAALNNNGGAAAIYWTNYSELPTDANDQGAENGQRNLWGFIR